MLLAEAQWLGPRLRALPATAFPLANLGSSTSEYRKRRSPWAQEFVFDALEAASGRVMHVDIKKSEGVDIVADLTTEEGRTKVLRAGPKSVLCTNLLEHVDDPAKMLEGVVGMCAPGSYLIVTGPKRFPYHPDPIDNGFRPGWVDVCTLLGDRVDVVDGADLRCRRMAFYYARGYRRLPILACRLAMPFYRPREWLRTLGWVCRRPVAFCLLARVKASTPDL